MKTFLIVTLAFALWVSAGRPSATEAAQRVTQGAWEYAQSDDVKNDAHRIGRFSLDLLRRLWAAFE